MKTFTFEVQVATDPSDEGAGWRVVTEREVASLGDDWTARMVAEHAARDQWRRTDPLWRVVVWDGDTRETAGGTGYDPVDEYYSDEMTRESPR